MGGSGTGNFIQSGGTNNGSVTLGSDAGSSGSYNLSGSGLLSAGGNQYVGDSGAGAFTHSGGTNSVGGDLYLGSNPGSSGSYSLGDSGLLSTGGSEYVGYSGTGTFTHSGGTNTVGGNLYLGSNSGSSGTYILSGSGLLSATNEYLACNPGATALLQQTGGTNATGFLSIGSGGQYQFGGGALQITGPGLTNQGVLTFGGTASLSGGADCIIDLSQASLQNAGSLSVSMGANSLLIVPAGFNTATGFSSYSSLGLTHTAGTTLAVPAGKGFSGWGSINDPVNCQGTITAAAGGSINLNNGLVLSGGGSVSLGNGSLTVDDSRSAISNGSLLVNNQYVGYAGTGVFTQSDGANTVSSNLFLGYNSGSSGTYILGAGGQLSAADQYIGYNSGAAALFQQTGGENAAAYLSIGSGGRYLFSGGTLQVNAGLVDYGIFDGGNSSAVLTGSSNCILDFSAGTLQNVGATRVSMGVNSLLIVPAGFNPSTGFGSYSSLGLTHTAGTTLAVPAGQGFGGWGSINDPVNCQGTIIAAGGFHQPEQRPGALGHRHRPLGRQREPDSERLRLRH